MHAQPQSSGTIVRANAPADDEGARRFARSQRYRTRFYRVWGYIGIAIIVVAVAWCLGRISDAISVLIVGALFAFIFAPITNFLDRRFNVPRLPGTFIGMLVVFLIIVLLALVIFPPLVSQAANFVSALPGFVAELQDLWNQFNEFLSLNPEGQVQTFLASLVDTVSNQVNSIAGNVAQATASGLFSGIKSVFSSVVNTFMALVISFWLAKDFPRMEKEVANIVGPRHGEDYRTVTSVFGRSLSGYLKGLLITSTCTGVIAGLGYWILGVPYSMLLGVLTAVLNVIPYIGPWIGGILAALVGLSVGIFPAIMSIVVTVFAQQFTDDLISPKVMQSAVSLHPVLVILALSAGGALGGIIGMIAAVPLTAAFKGTFIYYFEKKTGRQLVSKEGSLFKGEPFCDEDGNPRPACDALGVDLSSGGKGIPERIREAMANVKPDPATAHQQEQEQQQDTTGEEPSAPDDPAATSAADAGPQQDPTDAARRR